MAGRKTKLTPELQTKLCDAIAQGNYYQAACACVGIDWHTFRLWMRKGKKTQKGQLRDFFNAVKKAEADAEARIVAQWQSHMPNNYQACRDFLARRHPERWAQSDKLELRGNKKKPLRVMMTDEQFDALPLADRVRLLQEEMEVQDGTNELPPPAGA